jgi:Domain of unknown function (DUF222)
MTEEEREAWLADEEEPFDPEEWPDPEGPPPPGEDELTADELAGIREAAADEMLALKAASAGRRGPGQPGSARQFPGESSSAAGGFGPGLVLDVTPGCPGLVLAADAAAGDGNRFGGACDAELVGVLCAWDRIEAHAAERKLAAAAELIRRRPETGCEPEGRTRMPAAWDEFTADELAMALGESRGHAEGLLTMAWHLETRLPGTKAALRDGTVSRYKAEIIVYATALLDPAEARAAEAKVLDRAARLTPGGLRAAVARAVMEVAPDKARRRREAAARDARVQRWIEDSGNAALMGRELPPAEVLAADQRITAWAKQLKAAGLDGDMDVLRARAYLDLLLGKDSRPRQDTPSDPADSGPDEPGTPPASGPQPGAVPAGLAGRVTLTVPVATLLDLAGRPGEIPGVGPVDPWLARDLAAAAAASPKTTWCVTVTDEHGQAIGHGCARPAPMSHRKQHGPDPPEGNRDGPGFAFTAVGQHGPPGRYGTWRLRTPGEGPDLIVALEPVTTDPCDDRLEAKGHDPGVQLRHLSQVRHATCTSPVCRRPAATSDFEHNVPFEAGGRTCLCNAGPKCRHDHRLKQHPKWHVDQLPDGTFTWTTPSGRQYTTEPTRYPI